MAFALEEEKIYYSIDDIYALPEGKRAELIDGQIFYMAPPSRRHQLIAGELFTVLKNYIHSRKMDYFTKLFKYRNAGVREYWIVDFEKDRITVYDFDSEDTSDYTFMDTIKTGIYDDLYINFARIKELL